MGRYDMCEMGWSGEIGDSARRQWCGAAERVDSVRGRHLGVVAQVMWEMTRDGGRVGKDLCSRQSGWVAERDTRAFWGVWR